MPCVICGPKWSGWPVTAGRGPMGWRRVMEDGQGPSPAERAANRPWEHGMAKKDR